MWVDLVHNDSVWLGLAVSADAMICAPAHQFKYGCDRYRDATVT